MKDYNGDWLELACVNRTTQSLSTVDSSDKYLEKIYLT